VSNLVTSRIPQQRRHRVKKTKKKGDGETYAHACRAFYVVRACTCACLCVRFMIRRARGEDLDRSTPAATAQPLHSIRRKSACGAPRTTSRRDDGEREKGAEERERKRNSKRETPQRRDAMRNVGVVAILSGNLSPPYSSRRSRNTGRISPSRVSSRS